MRRFSGTARSARGDGSGAAGPGQADRGRRFPRCRRTLGSVVWALSLLSASALEAAAPPPVGADHAMIVSAHRLASEAGLDMLRRGGNVVDAAVAAGYALAVVWPAAGNLGGGGFMTIRQAGRAPVFLDFREKAPLAATETMFLDADGNVVPNRSTDSWLAVGVPGSVAGLDAALARYGTLPRAVVMAPAIQLAREGFTLGPADADMFGLVAPMLARDPQAASIFLPAGKPPGIGDRLPQPDLAATLQAISEGGADAFYRGPIGGAIADASAAGGGLLTREDFARYRVREMAPLACSYRGYDVLTAPPPSAGGIAICESLNILEGYDLHALGFHSAASVHLVAESLRRAFHDRQRLGDPDFVENPVAILLDKGYAARLRAGIAPERATPFWEGGATPDREGRQTTHFSVADADGNAVAVTTTLNGWFGAMRVAGRTGILVNNEMDDFASKPGAPNMFGLAGSFNNAVAPGKTPLSTMSPTIVTRDGKLFMVLGSPGGSRIASIVLEALVNVIDHGMALGEAVDAPRFHEQWQPDIVEVEPYALSPDTRRLLEASGYTVRDKAPWGQAEAVATIEAVGSAAGIDLPVLARPSRPFALYGVNDERGPAGAAAGY